MTHDQRKALAEGMGLTKFAGRYGKHSQPNPLWHLPDSRKMVVLDWLTSAEGCMWILERLELRQVQWLIENTADRRKRCVLHQPETLLSGYAFLALKANEVADTLPEAVALAAWKAMGEGK
jgi:hypothetical protein